MIADKVLRNELKTLGEYDPSLLEELEDVFNVQATREAFRRSQESGDPRQLLDAMTMSEQFHCRSNVAEEVPFLPLLLFPPVPTAVICFPDCLSYALRRCHKTAAGH